MMDTVVIRNDLVQHKISIFKTMKNQLNIWKAPLLSKDYLILPILLLCYIPLFITEQWLKKHSFPKYSLAHHKY